MFFLTQLTKGNYGRYPRNHRLIAQLPPIVQLDDATKESHCHKGGANMLQMYQTQAGDMMSHFLYPQFVALD